MPLVCEVRTWVDFMAEVGCVIVAKRSIETLRTAMAGFEGKASSRIWYFVTFNQNRLNTWEIVLFSRAMQEGARQNYHNRSRYLRKQCGI